MDAIDGDRQDAGLVGLARFGFLAPDVTHRVGKPPATLCVSVSAAAAASAAPAVAISAT
jgi:hypothetical protein